MTTTVVKAKRWLRALSVCIAALVLICGYGFLRIERNDAQDCHTRQEGRDAVRTLVVLAVGNSQSTNPLVARLRESLEPGGDLEQIKC